MTAHTATLNAQSDAAQQWPSPLTPQYYLAEMATPEEIAVVVSADDFAEALRELVPSVSQAEMARYAEIRERFSRSSAANGEAADGEAVVQEFKDKGKGKAKDVSVYSEE